MDLDEEKIRDYAHHGPQVHPAGLDPTSRLPPLAPAKASGHLIDPVPLRPLSSPDL